VGAEGDWQVWEISKCSKEEISKEKGLGWHESRIRIRVNLSGSSLTHTPILLFLSIILWLWACL
jgi:hypothetical protein